MPTFIVIGLKIETYIDKKTVGHNCDFTAVDHEFERHLLYCLDSKGKPLCVTFNLESTICSSGWCTATIAHYKIDKLDSLEGIFFDYLPNNHLRFDLDELETNQEDKSEEMLLHSFDVFEFSKYGDDEYYPGGYYSINMKNFDKVER